MTTGATGQLGLALPVQGELSGTWGDTVNNGTTQYTNIAIAATLTLTNDGAVTLANTTGDASASNITSTLTGAGTVTAQFAIVRVTGTLTTAKVVTAPSYSKTYTVVNAATGGIVTFKAAGQTGVSIAVGESAFVYFNGTDYVKVSSTVATGVTSFTAGTTGFTPNTATTGAVTLAGTLATTNGGTGLTSFTSGGVVYASSSSALATGSGLVFDGTNLGLGVTPSAWGSGTRGFQVLKGGLWHDNSQYFSLVNNAYYDGTNWKYISTAASSQIVQINGESRFYNAASGTAGNNVTFTQAMTLDVSGNLGIGTTSPTAAQLVIKGDGATAQIRAQAATNTNQGLSFIYNYSGGYGRINCDEAGVDQKDLWYNALNHKFGRNTSSANMTLDASGNLLLGTTASNYRLHVNGGGSSGNSSVYAQFTTADTGTANTDGLLMGLGVGASPIGYINQLENAAFVILTNATERTRISAAGGFSVGTTADPGAGAIYATGNITAYYSDARLKTVSGKIENALDKVAQLSGVYYTNNSVAKSFGYDSDEVQVGVLAQDVEAVLPQIVKAAPFDLDENNNSKSGENYKTVQYERLVPLLIEAINELRAEVKALKGE